MEIINSWMEEGKSGRLNDFYAIFKDAGQYKIHRWDYQEGNWRPFWKQKLETRPNN